MSYLKRYLSEYVGAKVIFTFDMCISLFSSFIVLLLLNYATDASYNSIKFALVWMGSSMIGSAGAMLLFKSYQILIRHSTLRDLFFIAVEIAVKGIFMTIVLFSFSYLRRGSILALLFDVMVTFGMALMSRISLIMIYDAYKARSKELAERKRVLIFGTSDKSVAAQTRLQNSEHYDVVGFIGYEGETDNFKLNNTIVYTYRTGERMKKLIDNLSVSCILFANETDVRQQEKELVDFCLKNKVQTLILPTIEEVAAGKIMKHSVRSVKIEDLLGRDEIRISMDEIRDSLKGKVVMVTGAAGSIGSELCRQLARFDVRKLVLFDNAETPMHYIRLELEERFPAMEFVPIIGDVRSVQRLDFAFREHRPDVVFHAAAYKHVPLMEENPCEAVTVNVHGTRNVADKCVEYGVGKMVMISTDKAVNPTNIMGCSKRLAEIYVQSLGAAIEKGEKSGVTKFVTTRFGNVLGSNGSVIPRFREQIEKGGPVTVTHPRINRFFMTIPEACRLVMEAATMGIHNRILVFDMGEPVMIVDLAKRMIELSGLKVGVDIDIEFTGLRPGEKLYEEVLATAEGTDPTSHDRIRVARIREYDYEEILVAVEQLTKLSAQVEIPDMVRLMKQVVPEFKSQNSMFSEYDR